jgi:hypothetical protein
MARAPIPEHLMHRIWKDPAKYLIDQPILADGTPLTIVNSGHYNDHRGGPDFLNAELSLQGLSITGDVELHTCCSNMRRRTGGISRAALANARARR